MQRQKQNRRGSETWSKNKVGQKSSGKRAKCKSTGCIAMASPSGSGYCSWHESQALEVGQGTDKVYKCKTYGCHNAQQPDCEYCPSCEGWLAGMSDIQLGREPGYKGDKPLVYELGDEPRGDRAARERAGKEQNAEKTDAEKPTPYLPSAAEAARLLEQERKYREAASKPKPKSPLAKFME